jgi:hypothetical protein
MATPESARHRGKTSTIRETAILAKHGIRQKSNRRHFFAKIRRKSLFFARTAAQASLESSSQPTLIGSFPSRRLSMAKYDDDDDDSAPDIRRPRGGDDVPNYLVQAVLVTLCCCLPLGIVAIIKASQVNGFSARGDYEGAVRASEEAKKWCWIAFILGIIANAVAIGLQIFLAGMGGGPGGR